MPVVANAALPAPFRYGFSASTIDDGTYDFTLPLPAETRCAAPALVWNLVLPDGQVFTGPAPAVSGPLSLDDLIEAHDWVQSQGLVTLAPLSGTVMRQTVAVIGGATSVQVYFAGGNMPSANYRIFLRPGADTGTGAIPDFDVPTRSVAGFTVTFSPGFTGSFDYVAWGG